MKNALILAPVLIGMASAAIAAPMSPQEYVAAAGASDLFERTEAHVVLASTVDPKIRSFAEMMVKDHTTSTKLVKAAAMRAHITAAPPMLTDDQRQMLADLRGATGPARDTTYITQQKTAHDQALAMQQAYAADGTSPPLKSAAATIVPVVEHHIAMLKAM